MEVSHSDYSNTIALSASVVSVHVWTNQDDLVRLVRAKWTSAQLWLEHLVCRQCLTCGFVLIRDCLTRDDAIGTAFLNLSTMSSSGGEIEGNNLSDYPCGDYSIVLYLLNVPVFIHFFIPLKQMNGLRPATLCQNVRASWFVALIIVKKKKTFEF